MSRERRVDVVRWWDENGKEYTDRRVVKENGTLAQLPRKRIVDVCCPSGHLVAVVARAPLPLVFTPGPDGPVPALVLHPSGLAGAMTSRDAEGVWTVGSLGTPRESHPIYCRECREEWPLLADELHEASGRARAGRPARVVLGRV